MKRFPYLHHIPNGITVSRIAIAAAFPFTPESLHFELILAGLLTEFLDGFIARTCKWTSHLGEVLDPIADKLFVASVCLTWIWLGNLTVIQWLLLGTRDIGVLLICLVLLTRGRLKISNSIPAQLPSKITTGFQYLVFLVLLTGGQAFVSPLILAAAAFGTIATIHYAGLTFRALRVDP